jgi:Papain family cysteine protease
MRLISRVLAGSIVFAVVAIGAHAQGICGYPPTPNSPVQYVSDDVFSQMVGGGSLVPVTPDFCLEAKLGGLFDYLLDEAYVADYLRRNPELTDLAALVESNPNPNDPYVHRNPNGTYDVTIFNSQGSISQGANAGAVAPPVPIGTVKNFGRRTKMKQLSGSIRSATDPVVQLRNYTALYNQLPASFVNGTNIPEGVAYTQPIPPSQLQGAPLETILDALDLVTSQWRIIVPLFPPSPTISAVSCSAEVGVNALASSPGGEVNYGDEAPLASTCRAPEAYGLYANFNFLNKNAASCVKNQGNRGTCGVFAATSAVEELITLSTATHPHVNLSEEDFWENLTLNWTVPAQLYEDGYDAGDALSLALVNKYQFAYENQWDYNPSNSQPETGYEYVNTCENYPYPLLEPACSNSSPQAVEYCTFSGSLHVERCGFLTTTLPTRSPYSIGPGSFFAPDQAMSSSKSSVVGSITDIWIASGVPPATMCPSPPCPPDYGTGPHPNITVNSMILALVMNNTVILGFEETDGFGEFYYTPCCDATPPCPTCMPPTAGGDLTTDAGGHNIHVIGYIDNADVAATMPAPPAGPGLAQGSGYFVLKNSWGACSGDGGYFYMDTDYVKKRAQAVYVLTPGS